MRRPLLRRWPTGVLVAGLLLLACGSDGPTRRAPQPTAAALAVVSTGGCYVGRGEFGPHPDGHNDFEVDAAATYIELRYTPFSECGGRKSLEYFVSLANGTLALAGTGSTSKSKAGVTWRLTTPGTIRFLSSRPLPQPPPIDAGEVDAGDIDAGDDASEIDASDAADASEAGTEAVDAAPPPVTSSKDGRELDTIASVDDATQSRLVVMQFVLNEDLTYACIFKMKLGAAAGEFQACSDSSGCGSSSGGSSSHHDFDD